MPWCIVGMYLWFRAEVHKIFRKSRNNFNILGVRRVTWSQVLYEGPTNIRHHYTKFSCQSSVIWYHRPVNPRVTGPCSFHLHDNILKMEEVCSSKTLVHICTTLQGITTQEITIRTFTYCQETTIWTFTYYISYKNQNKYKYWKLTLIWYTQQLTNCMYHDYYSRILSHLLSGLMWYPKFQYSIYNSLPMVSVLSQFNPVHKTSRHATSWG